MKLFTTTLIFLLFIGSAAHSKIKPPKTHEEAEKFYWEHIEKATKDQVIIVPKTTLACATKEGLKKGLKALLANNPRFVAKYGCGYTRIVAGALITEMQKNSKIVRLAYRLHGDHKGIGHSYFYWPHLFTEAQFDKMNIN